jgi:hypothetical protein
LRLENKQNLPNLSIYALFGGFYSSLKHKPSRRLWDETRPDDDDEGHEVEQPKRDHPGRIGRKAGSAFDHEIHQEIAEALLK